MNCPIAENEIVRDMVDSGRALWEADRSLGAVATRCRKGAAMRVRRENAKHQPLLAQFGEFCQ